MIIRGQALQKDKSTGAIRVRHISINLGNHQLGDKGFTPHIVKSAVNRACSSGKATVPLVLLEGFDATFPFPDGNIPVLDLGGENPYTWAQNYAAPTFSVSTDSYTYYRNQWRQNGHMLAYTAFIFLSKDSSIKIPILVRHLASQSIKYIKEVARQKLELPEGLLISDKNFEQFLHLAPPAMDWAIEATRIDLSGESPSVYQPFE